MKFMQIFILKILLLILVTNCTSQHKEDKSKVSHTKYTLKDFTYTTIENSLAPLPHKEYSSLKKWSDIFITEWVDSVSEGQNSKSFRYPILEKNSLFTGSSIKNAWDAESGRELNYGEQIASRFSNNNNWICLDDYNGKGAVVNVITGQVFSNDSILLPPSKSPFFLHQNVLLYSPKNSQTKLLVAEDLNSHQRKWTITNENFNWSRACQIKDYLFYTTKESLYAVSLTNGNIIWELKAGINYLKFSGGTIYLGLKELKSLLALDINNPAKPLVKFSLKLHDTPVAVAEDSGILYVQEETLNAFDLKQKKFLWKAEWIFSTGVSDQLGLSSEYIFSNHTEEPYIYTVVINKKTGELISADNEVRFLIAEKYLKNAFFGVNWDNSKIYSFNVK